MESRDEVWRRFGQRVRALREQRGWKLDDLGTRLHKSRASMSRIERGKQNLTMLDLMAIAQALEVRVADLFQDGSASAGGAGPDVAPPLVRDMDMEMYETLYAQYEALGVTLARLMTLPPHSLREWTDWHDPAALPALALAGSL